ARAPATCADVALAFALLLVGAPRGFLALAAREVALVLALAFVLGGAGLLERNRDGLARVLHLARLAARSAFQLAMLVLVHDAAHRLALGHRSLGHELVPLDVPPCLRTIRRRLGCAA